MFLRSTEGSCGTCVVYILTVVMIYANVWQINYILRAIIFPQYTLQVTRKRTLRRRAISGLNVGVLMYWRKSVEMR